MKQNLFNNKNTALYLKNTLYNKNALQNKNNKINKNFKNNKNNIGKQINKLHLTPKRP